VIKPERAACTLILFCAVSSSSSLAAVLAPQPTFTEYSVPTPSSRPQRIASGPDGALWFTEGNTNKIGRVTTGGSFNEFTLPQSNSNPQGIVTGPDGALWFTELNTSTIGRITTAGLITEYKLSAASAGPQGITAGPDGALWFTEIQSSKIGRIATSGSITEYPIPSTLTVSSLPYGIAAGPDGNLWFAEQQTNKIGRITTSGVITQYTLPTTSNSPTYITAGSDGAMWFAEISGKIGRVTTSGLFTEYAIPTIGSNPVGITAGPDGALWFTEVYGNKIGRVTPNGAFTEYTVPTDSSAPWDITVGSDKALWFTEAAQPGGNKIGRLQVLWACTNTTAPAITSIFSASAYGGYPYFASGTWLEIKGTNLADAADPRLANTSQSGQWAALDFTGPNAPTSLDGVSVSINGKPAFVWYLSPGQLNVQAPEDSTVGNVAVTVTNCNAASSAFTLARQSLAPGVLAPSNYAVNGTQYMVATFSSDGAYVLDTVTGASFGLTSRPAKPGDVIIAYGIGFGDVTPSILPGVTVQQTNALVNPVTVAFGSTAAALSYSGLAGSFVGLYEFYITVPSGLADGTYQIHVSQNGAELPQTLFLTVQN
jgi:virginiamycin B lyase